MNRLLIAGLLLAAAAPLGAQGVVVGPGPDTPLPPIGPAVDPQVGALRDSALDGDTYAWDIVEGGSAAPKPRRAPVSGPSPS